MKLLPNVTPEIFSISAVVVGYLLIDDLSSNEQNALGNWLMLVAQVLCTNATYKQAKANPNDENITNPSTSAQDTVGMLQKMMQALQQEIDDIKKSL